MDLYPTVDSSASSDGFAAQPGTVTPADGNYGVGATHGPAGATNPIDVIDTLVLGPNHERLEELKPELVNALRELVRQYRAEGIAARRHEIRRIRQARLFLP